MKLNLSKKFLFFPALALGIMCLILLVQTGKKPKRIPAQERAVTVRVLQAPLLPVVPRVVGYGYIQAGQEWAAVTEVSGQVVEINPRLKKGALLAKDELLVRLDPAKRLTARRQSSADVNSLLAQLRELEQTEADTRRSYTVEVKSLELARNEYERMKRLLESGTISRSEMDEAERVLLTQENKVQSYRSTLNSLPAQKQSLLANIASSRSKLEEADIDLSKTIIRAPFDCRITDVSVERGQAVSLGQTIVTADSIGLSEAVAQMPMYLFRHVIPRGSNPMIRDGKLDTVSFQHFLSLDAQVRIEIGNDTVSWTGRVSRLNDSIDASTRTIGVYIAVDDSYIKAEPGKRPPLLPNMFCEVQLMGKPLEPAVTIPRSALHGNIVYVMTPEHRLDLRTVDVDFPQGNIVVLRSGVTAGEQVVLSDVIPAVQGMLLEPQQDDDALAALHDEALGGGSVR